MELVFEELQSDDLEECYRMCMSSFNENCDFAEVKRIYDTYKDNPAYIFLVGKLGGNIAAYSTVNFQYNLFDGERPIMTLWYVCVDERYRRNGVARKMLEKIDRIASEHNCELIQLLCLPENSSAIELYRSAGYTDKDKAFVKLFY